MCRGGHRGHRKRLAFGIRVVRKHVKGRRCVLVNRRRVVARARRVVGRGHNQLCARACRFATGIHYGVVKRNVSVKVAVHRGNGHLTATRVDHGTVLHVRNCDNAQRAAFHVRVVRQQVHGLRGLRRGRFGTVGHRLGDGSLVILRNGLVVYRRNNQLERRFRAERAIRRGHTDLDRSVRVFHRLDGDDHVVTGSVRNRNILGLDNALVARRKGIARVLRHVVVHVADGQRNRFGRVFRRRLVIAQIADDRLVVDREHGDRCRRRCGLRRRGFIGYRDGKRIRTVEIRIRRVENRVVRAKRRGAVLRCANRNGCPVAIHLIIARQRGKANVRILADRFCDVADDRRVVLRRNGQVNRLFRVGKPVADANNDDPGAVHVCERMHRNGLPLRRHLRGIPGLEHDGRARGGGLRVNIEVQVGSAAVDVVEGYVKRSGC